MRRRAAACLLLLFAPGRGWRPLQSVSAAHRASQLPRGRPPQAVASLAPTEFDASARPVDPDTVAVLLLNLGGPDTLDNVKPFLYNLFSDPEIITLPSFLEWANKPLAWIIANSRAPDSREGYKTSFRLWEEFPGSEAIRSVRPGAPQLSTTQVQGKALEEALAARGIKAKSYIAMRYWSPYTSDALAAMKADGVQRMVVLPLYPQFSISTSGSSLRQLEREFYADQTLRQVRNVVIPAWYNREGYINALAKLIIAKWYASQRAATRLELARRRSLRARNGPRRGREGLPPAMAERRRRRPYPSLPPPASRQPSPPPRSSLHSTRSHVR